MKETRKYIRKCPQCGQKLLKNGKENGKQRWRCLHCGTACIRSRVDVADQNRQKTYTKHLLGKGTANEMARSKGISRRTFDRKYATGLQGLSSVRSVSGTSSATYHPDELQPAARFIVIDAKRLNHGIVAIAQSNTGRLYWCYALCTMHHTKVVVRGTTSSRHTTGFTCKPLSLTAKKVFSWPLASALASRLSCSAATSMSSRTYEPSSPNTPLRLRGKICSCLLPG